MIALAPIAMPNAHLRLPSPDEHALEAAVTNLPTTSAIAGKSINLEVDSDTHTIK